MRITGLEGRNIRVIDVKKTEMIGERKKMEESESNDNTGET